MIEFLLVVLALELGLVLIELTAYVGLVGYTMVQELRKPKNPLVEQIYAQMARGPATGEGCGNKDCAGCGDKKAVVHSSGGNYG